MIIVRRHRAAHLVNNPVVSPLSFEVVGYGCMTCIGNSGPLPEPVVEAVTQVPGGCFQIPSATFQILLFSSSVSLLCLAM